MSDAEGPGPDRLVPDDVTPPSVGDGAEPGRDAGVGGTAGGGDEEELQREAIAEPAKLMRVGSMVKQLLDEVHNTDLDEASRSRLRDIYRTSIGELGDAVSDDLRDELARLAPLFEEDEVPTDAELRIAHAQLVGWLEGLFHGIQATLFAQQMAARQQLEGMRGQLPEGAPGGPGPDHAPGTYL